VLPVTSGFAPSMAKRLRLKEKYKIYIPLWRENLVSKIRRLRQADQRLPSTLKACDYNVQIIW
jgi:hypothetical protein